MHFLLTDRLRSLCLVAAAAGIALMTACSSDKGPTAPTVTVTSVAISGAPATGVVGQNAALVATATFSDNTQSNVTTQAAWESSNNTVATVTPAGVVTYLAPGGVDIRATFRGVVGTSNITVAAPAPIVTSIAVTGISGSPLVGSSGALVATATYSNNTTAVVTTQVAWNSSNAGVATVTATGAVSFVGEGDVDLRATLGGITGTLRVTVAAQLAFRNLDGTVKDGVSNSPIEGVQVVVRGGPNDGRSARTDANGGYGFSGLQTGSFTLEFSSDKPYSSVSRNVNLSDDTRLDVTLDPNVGVYYGTFTVSLTVLQDTCNPPPNLTGFGTGTLQLAGQSNGTNVTVRITERGVSRTYTGGRMNIDGTFNGGLPAGTLFPGAIRPNHEIFASMQGKVTGNTVTGTENLTYTVGCQPGAVINIALSGNK